MTGRKQLTKSERKSIFAKTDAHCAYCGADLEIENMQVDHIIPINGWHISGPDTIDNMLPACRSCNHYKSRSLLEGFRKMLENMPHALMRDSVTYRNAVRYGLVIPQSHPVIFYFEKYKKEEKARLKEAKIQKIGALDGECPTQGKKGEV
jgi:hypothetical protein